MVERSLTGCRTESPPPAYDYLYPGAPSHTRSSDPDPQVAEDTAIPPKKPSRKGRKSDNSGADGHRTQGIRNRLRRLQDLRLTVPIYFRDRDDRRKSNEAGSTTSFTSQPQPQARSASPRGEGKFSRIGANSELNTQPESAQPQEERPPRGLLEDNPAPAQAEQEVLFNPWLEGSERTGS